MNTILEQTANRAIFHLQLNTQDAITYISKHAKVAREQASQAMNNAMLFHKTSKVN